MRNKNFFIRLLTILFITQLFYVSGLQAKTIDVNIPAQTHERKWGTINIPTQIISLEDDDDEDDYKFKRRVEYTVTNIPEGFGFSGLCNTRGYNVTPSSNGSVIPMEMSYYDYLNISNLDVAAEPLPIKSPQDMVNVINGFVPGGATLNDKGEVVVLKVINIPLNATAGDANTGQKHWPIQTNVTIVRGADYGQIEYFNFDIENSFVSIIDGAVLDCDFNISNSTIGIGSTGWADFGIGISSTKGNVFFKGIPYGGEQFNQYCLSDRPYAVFSLYSKMGNSTLSFEDLSVTFRNPTIHPSTTFNFRNCDIIIHSTFVGEEEKLTVQGGNVNIDNCLFSYNPSNTSHIVVESGKLQIDNSDINANISVIGNNANVVTDSVKTDRLVVEKGKAVINNCYYENGITINGGSLEVNNGYYPNGITINGGELEVNDGAITSLNVNKEDCKIELNNGHFKSVNMPIKVKKPILSLLGPNASYYDRDGTYMPFKLVDIEGVEQKEGAIVTGMVYPVSFVISNYGSTPSAAYEAAQKADVGVNGKDIRMRENGDLEIWTPEGLAWLAFVQSDTHDRVLTGREYFEKSKDWYLMTDIDMDGYGTGWPNLNVSGRTFYGQQHRIYNMNIFRPDASFFNEINFNSVVRDLIVEGSVTNKDDKGGREIKDYIVYDVAGFAKKNDGLIVNCAFKGGVWNTAIGNAVNVSGFVSINGGRIENCYVAPCDQLIGGVRNENDSPLMIKYPCSHNFETYSVAGFASTNMSSSSIVYDDGSWEDIGGFIDNSYFGGQVTYSVPTSSDEYEFYAKMELGILSNRVDSCKTLYFLNADVSAETLNKNALEHTPEKYEGNNRYPYVEWAAWAESDDKQCGRPYFVWEKNLDDTPSGIDGVEAQGGFKAWSEDGMLCFCTDGSADVLVYSAGGRLCVRHSAQTGTERVALPKGIYIVKCGGTSKKVIL